MSSHGISRYHLSSLLNGLYLILDESWASRCSLPDVLRDAGQAGVKLVQYRNKTESMKHAYSSGEGTSEYCQRMGRCCLLSMTAVI